MTVNLRHRVVKLVPAGIEDDVAFALVRQDILAQDQEAIITAENSLVMPLDPSVKAIYIDFTSDTYQGDTVDD